jgi:hypothetical protein
MLPFPHHQPLAEVNDVLVLEIMDWKATSATENEGASLDKSRTILLLLFLSSGGKFSPQYLLDLHVTSFVVFWETGRGYTMDQLENLIYILDIKTMYKRSTRCGVTEKKQYKVKKVKICVKERQKS